MKRAGAVWDAEKKGVHVWGGPSGGEVHSPRHDVLITMADWRTHLMRYQPEATPSAP